MPIDLLDPVALTTSSDQELLAAHAAAVVERRCADAKLAAPAGEIARRSAPDAGMAGLARQTGDRTPAKLIERTAGIGADEAHQRGTPPPHALRVGFDPSRRPWRASSGRRSRLRRGSTNGETPPSAADG